VLANLSASNATVGKADWRRLICAAQSGKCVAAYLYGAAGMGESTTDLAWDGHALVFENGELRADSDRFRNEAQLVTADIDLDRLRQDRMRQTTFANSAVSAGARLERMRRIVVEGLVPPRTPLRRGINRFPFVPSERATLDDRCAEVF